MCRTNAYVTVSQAKQDTNANSVMTVENKESRAEQNFLEPAKDVLAQKGGTATLPCKLTDPGAGIVSIC